MKCYVLVERWTVRGEERFDTDVEFAVYQVFDKIHSLVQHYPQLSSSLKHSVPGFLMLPFSFFFSFFYLSDTQLRDRGFRLYFNLPPYSHFSWFPQSPDLFAIPACIVKSCRVIVFPRIPHFPALKKKMVYFFLVAPLGFQRTGQACINKNSPI